MLPSARRVASSAPGSPIILSFGSAASRGTRQGATPFLRSRHQRRYSSSKESKDSDATIPPVTRSVAPSAEAVASEGKAAQPKERKRRTKESEKQKLPSVPSTQHMATDSLALSTFFSLHRPMSVTHSLPKNVSEDAFAAIFTPRTKAQKASDVISTLSWTMGELTEGIAKHRLSDSDGHEGIHKFEARLPSGTETKVYLDVNAMSGHYHPFSPPPLPEPQAAIDSTADASTAESADATPRTRVYKAVFTIEESTDAEGHVQIAAHSPQLIEEHASEPRTFLERMAVRQLKWEDARENRDLEMLAISTKRQRKLKMKKKKFKKLLKTTRNIRRKLDKL